MGLECLPCDVRNAVEKLGEVIEVDELGVCYRVEISDGTSVFIKLRCETNGIFDLHFSNELVFYGDILKGAEVRGVPKCRGVGGGFVMLENLVSRGYRALDAKESMSGECARLALGRLGEFHAFSFVRRERSREEFAGATSKLQETVFGDEMRPTYGKLFLHGVHDALKLARQSLPKGSVYVEKLAAFTLNIFELMSNLARGDDDDSNYYVITHGDLWPNNIFCKFDEDTGHPSDAVFVDFQGCRYSSPVHDVMSILLLGLDQSVRETRREELLRHYHNSLCEKLQEHGLDPVRVFPFSAFQNQLGKHARFALAMGLVGLPLYLDEGSMAAVEDCNKAEPTDDVRALFEFVQSVNARKTMKCKNKMIEIIMDVVDQGYLD